VNSLRCLAATLATITIGVALTGCTAKESKDAAGGQATGSQVSVNATDSECALSASEGGTGSTSFVVTNNGTKVTEFYVYGKDDRVLGEVENISPGLQRQLDLQLDEPGSYRVACKPGMVGDGIRADFTVKRDQP
jgi:iron uptake system component EfeO